jgi:hypothetical protein
MVRRRARRSVGDLLRARHDRGRRHHDWEVSPGEITGVDVDAHEAAVTARPAPRGSCPGNRARSRGINGAFRDRKGLPDCDLDTPFGAGVAQPVEQRIRNAQVRGSIPRTSSILYNHLRKQVYAPDSFVATCVPLLCAKARGMSRLPRARAKLKPPQMKGPN